MTDTVVSLYIFLGTLICVSLIMHLISVITLIKHKELRTNVFLKCLLFLNLDDSLLLIGCFNYGILILTNTITDLACDISLICITGSLIFSTLITLVICIEQLACTFLEPNKYLKMLSSYPSICLGIIFCHIYPFIYLLSPTSTENRPCQTETYNDISVFYLMIDVPWACLAVAITIVYIIIIVRMVQQYKKLVHMLKLGQTQEQSVLNRYNILKRSVVTLTVIIVIVIIPVISVLISDLFAVAGDANSTQEGIIDILTLIKPMVDPVIYVLRIKEYRKALFKCKCGNTQVIPMNEVSDIV